MPCGGDDKLDDGAYYDDLRDRYSRERSEMPCSDGRDHSYYEKQEHRERRRAEAMLCGVMRALECMVPQGLETFLGRNYDGPAAGVSFPSLWDWWQQHKRIDELRLEREREAAAAEQRREADRQRGLAKLTPEERAALGLS